MSSTPDTPDPTAQSPNGDSDPQEDAARVELDDSTPDQDAASPAIQPAEAGEVPPDAEELGPLTPEEFAEEIHWHDMLLGLLVVLLALLLSFFKISNMELWRHLRTGEYIAEHGVPETDIFSYTADQRRWINPHWLFAVASHQVHKVAGFKGLVAGKVVLVVCVALLLLSIRHQGPTLWWTVITTAVGLIMLNKQFQVSPDLFTYFAVTAQLAVFFQAQFRQRMWMLWLLVPLQAVWVNVDRRYYVGVLLAALMLVGMVLERMLAREKEQPANRRKNPVTVVALVFVGILLACFVNPYDLRNPAGLAAVSAPLQHYALFDRGLPDFGVFPSLMSVFDQDYWMLESYTWDEYGTLLLVLLVLVSFGMNWRRFHLPRFLVFAGFLVMCLLLLEYLYLLALVSVVVLCLNGQEWFLDRFGTQPRIDLGWLIWSRGGRVVTVLTLVALFLYGASGRLRNSLGNDLGLGVDTQVTDSYSAVSELLTGLPETARGFHFGRLPHDANLLIACTYPNPTRPVFLDDRLELYRRGRVGPNGVTRVDLAALPAKVMIPTADNSDATLEEELEQFPNRVEIPDSYAQRLWYERDEKRLKLRGSLGREELEELLREAATEEELLGLPVPGAAPDTYGLARRAYTSALRNLYTRARARYDRGSATLSFRGTMTPDDYAVLLSLSVDEQYRQAVRELFDRSQDLMITYLRLRELLFNDDAEVWEKVFDKYGINYLTLQLGPPPDRFGYRTFLQLSRSPHWEPVTPLTGSLALFIRTDVQDRDLVDYRAAHRLDFQELAYREDPEAPPLEPAVSVQPYTWYFDALWRSRYAPSEKLFEAVHYQRFADDYLNPLVSDVAAFRLLSIRSIRKALLENPGNPQSYMVLADAYHKLLELEWAVLPHPAAGYGTARTSLARHNVRYYQLIAALNQALAADPDLLEAHDLLVFWYQKLGYVDLMLRHLQRVHELVGQDPENALLRLQNIAVLERRVQEMRNTLAGSDLASRSPLERAQYAFQNGFPALALEELGGSSGPGLAPESAPLYVQLCLETGQHERAAPVLERLQNEPLLFPDGRWEQLMGIVRLLQGNYAQAAENWNLAIRRKEYRVAMDVLRGSGLLMRGLQSSPSDPPGLWQGYGFSLTYAARNLLALPLDRSTDYAWLGLAYLETPFASRAIEPLQRALEVEPNNPLRPVIVYYLTKLTGETIDPFGPAEYLEPQFAPEPEQPPAQAQADAPDAPAPAGESTP